MLNPVAFPEPVSLLVLLLLAQSGSKLVAKKPAAFNLTYSLPDLRREVWRCAMNITAWVETDKDLALSFDGSEDELQELVSFLRRAVGYLPLSESLKELIDSFVDEHTTTLAPQLGEKFGDTQ